jgi:hypothetical protein
MKKQEFRERSVGEIRKLNVHEVDSPVGLVRKIVGLTSNEGVILSFSLFPEKENRGMKSREVAKRFEAYAPEICVAQPETQLEAFNCQTLPLEYISQSIKRKLENIPEEEVFFPGYSFSPVQETKTDGRKRVFHLYDIWIGKRLFAFSFSQKNPMQVHDYSDVKVAATKGGNIEVVGIPSTEEERKPYTLTFNCVPVLNNVSKQAIVLSLKADFSEQPGRRYHDKTYSRRLRFDPHEIAAYMRIMQEFFLQEPRNPIPFQMNPFLFPSRFLEDTARTIDNQVLIRDKNASKYGEKLRKPYLIEKSVLLMRAMKEFGVDACSWNFERDGKLSSY